MEVLRPKMYPTAKQKRKLITLMEEHPQLDSFRTTPNFNQRDSAELWEKIANECNAIPGATKGWKQWRKTWQDIKAKKKRKQRIENGEIIPFRNPTNSDGEPLVWKNVTSTTNYHDTMEFVAPEDDTTQDDNFNCNDSALFSETGSPSEVKVDINRVSHLNTKKLNNTSSENHSDCGFNCERLASQEEKKIQIKEDYYNFKKDYLKQKLLIMKEQAEALKDIAKQLAK